MKNKKMSLNPKKKCLYIKGIYITKNPKLNNSINTNIESKKTISDYNVNKKDSCTTTKQFPKKSVKPVYQTIQKSKCLIKGNQNFLSTKNIHIKSPKKEILDQQNIKETNIEINSGRKSGNKKYDINNLFKERSNSESAFNSFNRTYTTFNNNTNKENNQNGKNNNINGISNININNKENIKKNNNIDNKINYSYVTLPSKNNNELKINLNNINLKKKIYNIKK